MMTKAQTGDEGRCTITWPHTHDRIIWVDRVGWCYGHEVDGRPVLCRPVSTETSL